MKKVIFLGLLSNLKTEKKCNGSICAYRVFYQGEGGGIQPPPGPYGTEKSVVLRGLKLVKKCMTGHRIIQLFVITLFIDKVYKGYLTKIYFSQSI